MARRPRIQVLNLLHHVIARGNRREATFLDDRDYRAYRARLVMYRERYGVTLHAYCLMPNHVHLLVQTSTTPLATFMQGLQQSYTQWFHRTHGTVGHVFQGRYKAIVCQADAYLMTLVRYIHLNPVRAGLVDEPARHPYSGHRVYLAGVPDGLIDPGPVLAMLGGREAYRRFVQEARGDLHDDRYYQVADQQVLGDPGFVEQVRRQGGSAALARLPRQPLGEALGDVARRLGVDPELLAGPSRSRPVSQARAVVGLILVQRLGYRLTDVARALSRDTAALSITLGRITRRLADEPDLRRLLECADSAGGAAAATVKK